MSAGRRIQNIYETPFEPYDLDGPVETDKSCLPVSWTRESGRGCYVIRMEPGSENHSP